MSDFGINRGKQINLDSEDTTIVNTEESIELENTINDSDVDMSTIHSYNRQKTEDIVNETVDSKEFKKANEAAVKSVRTNAKRAVDTMQIIEENTDLDALNSRLKRRLFTARIVTIVLVGLALVLYFARHAIIGV